MDSTTSPSASSPPQPSSRREEAKTKKVVGEKKVLTPEEEAEAQAALDKHYFQNLRNGITLSVPELQVVARDLGLRKSAKQLSDMRFDYEFLAVRTPYRKQRRFFGPQIERLGTLFVDLLEYQKKLKVQNGNKFYVILAVDQLSGLTKALPLANKSQESWEKAILYFLDAFPLVRSVVTDADTSIAGLHFQARLRKEHGVRWFHLRVRSKVRQCSVQLERRQSLIHLLF